MKMKMKIIRLFMASCLALFFVINVDSNVSRIFGDSDTVASANTVNAMKIVNVKGGLILRATPDSKGKKVSMLKNSSQVYVYTTDKNGWSYIKQGKLKGYVPDKNLTTKKSTTTTTTTTTAIAAKNVFSSPSIFNYSVNSADGIKLTWMANYLGDKTIKYYTVNISTYNAVGDPSYDQISGKSKFSQKYVGPVAKGEEIVMFNLFTYQSALHKIVIDSVDIEYMDGTKVKVNCNYATTDDSGFE